MNGKRYENYADLLNMDEADNKKIVDEAKELYKSVRKIKHPDGYYQLFVSDRKETAN